MAYEQTQPAASDTISPYQVLLVRNAKAVGVDGEAQRMASNSGSSIMVSPPRTTTAWNTGKPEND